MHSHHEVPLACGGLCVNQVHELHLGHSGITAASRLCPWVSQERREDSASAASTAALGGRGYSDGSRASQERGRAAVFFQLPRLHLVCHGFKEQGTQYE